MRGAGECCEGGVLEIGVRSAGNWADIVFFLHEKHTEITKKTVFQHLTLISCKKTGFVFVYIIERINTTVTI